MLGDRSYQSKSLFYPKGKSTGITSGKPKFNDAAFRIYGQKAQEVVSNIAQRLAYLLVHPEEYGIFSYKEQSSRLYITHDELASFIGTTRPKITELLNIFMKQGVIDKGRGYIEIKDYNGLNRIADH